MSRGSGMRAGEAGLTKLAYPSAMSIYIRPSVPGATVFFTVALARRGSTYLVDHVGLLRDAVSETRATRPFHIDAIVVLPDHLHAVWALPEGDADFSTRWSAIKARFTRSLRESAGSERRPGFSPAPRPHLCPPTSPWSDPGATPG